MKYPAILRNILGNQTVLAVNAKLFIHMSGEFELEDSESYSFDSHYTNITHEYLSNTWGVVESKEHAEFIVELAKSGGIEVREHLYPNVKDAFSVSKNGTLFFHESCGLKLNSTIKQITIPLPPKAKVWPQVGDEVTANHDSGQILKGKLLAKTKEYAIIQQSGHEQHLYLNSWNLQKPKSKQELLIEELQTKLCNNNAVDSYILACDIINGEIEGLSYEGE